MHEADLTQEIVKQAREAATVRGASRVAGLRLAMTPTAGLTQDAILRQFKLLTSGDGLFEGATLRIEHRPVAATCLDCSDEFSTDAPEPICPHCGSQLVRLDDAAMPVQLMAIDVDGGGEESGGA